MVEAAGQRVGPCGEREVGGSAGVAAGDGGELGEGLQQPELLGARRPRREVAHRQDAADRAVPGHRHREGAADVAERRAGRGVRVGDVVLGALGLPRPCHAPGEPAARRQPVADELRPPAVGGLGRHPALGVAQVDDAAVRSYDPLGLGHDVRQQLAEVEVLVERLRRAGERRELRDAPGVLLCEADLRERSGGGRGERAGELLLGRGERLCRGVGEDEHVAGRVALSDRNEERRLRVQVPADQCLQRRIVRRAVGGGEVQLEQVPDRRRQVGWLGGPWRRAGGWRRIGGQAAQAAVVVLDGEQRRAVGVEELPCGADELRADGGGIRGRRNLPEHSGDGEDGLVGGCGPSLAHGLVGPDGTPKGPRMPDRSPCRQALHWPDPGEVAERLKALAC